MIIRDIRLLDKNKKLDIANNYSAEFAYVLSKKIKQPIYCSKRVSSLKYFVEYFSASDKDEDFKIVDLNRVISPKNKKAYEMVDPESLNLNLDVVNFLESEISNSFKKLFEVKDKNLTYTYYENDFYQTDIPFRRDVMVVRDKSKVISTCYVTGYLFNKCDVRNIKKDYLVKLIDSNSDCKKLKKRFKCNYDLMEDYLSNRYSKNFIDSVIVQTKYRSKGVCTKVYETIFRHFNSKEINLTSCKVDIQTDDAIRLWDKLKSIHPKKYRIHNNFNFLDYRNKKTSK